MTTSPSTIEAIIQRHPTLSFLQSGEFQALPEEKKLFLLECVGDALFWVEWEKSSRVTDGFKFLMASYGLNKAESQANEQNLEGRERATYLKPHKELYSLFNPQFGTDSPMAPSSSKE